MGKTNRPMVRIYTSNTEYIDREMNDAEFAQLQIDIKAAQTRKAEAEAKITQRQIILDKLGLTAEEAALLLS